ncbi:SURF1 family protein [Sphingobium phenoxybenzoativorans]|uniref:SURF1 family protein n=1 Tax=Sphingobium phenoxybenzoativorans TaxID=1592790 RepID=UPI00087214B6|nr:SURF1 family protein [Sphingobium phenoxybenzoativorans]
MTVALTGLLALLLVAGFVALGVWQVQRLAWKRALIASVDARIHAPPIAAPAPAEWPSITAQASEYRRISAHGVYRFDRQTLVRASTARGSGYWVMTPFDTGRGFTILVNRGFVPPGWKTESGNRPAAVTGLLRITEPGGGFLRANDPATGRWYSRDVAAIARALRLDRTAPYFIDAQAAGGPDALPVGGMTVVSFPNNHLVYAITWFALALMTAGGYMLFLREERRLRTAGGGAG